MRAQKPLYLTLFIMDILRLAALLTALSAYQSSSAELGNLGSAAIAYAAPQTLFLLMAFFLWRSPLQHEGFLPLYTAGKVISAFTIGAWLLKALPSAALALGLGLGKIGVLALLGVSSLIVIFDLISALFGLLLLRKDQSRLLKSTINAPDLVVESIDDTPIGTN